MKYTFSIGMLIILNLICIVPRAQVHEPLADIGAMVSKQERSTKTPVPYTHVREADIMWLQRVWRVVDMREKMNHVFYFPEKPAQGRKNLLSVLVEGIETGQITAYSPFDVDSITPNDMFTIPMTVDEALGRLRKKTYTTYYDDILEVEIDTVIYEEIPSSEVQRFVIKEEVFFDNRYSRMQTRILGIAPQRKQYINDEFVGYEELFWIYFPEVRQLFVDNVVYNPQNDVFRLTYDDIFWKRKFASRIIKVSNVYDRFLSDYNAPMDALLEAEKLKEKIRNREHDLWSY